MKNKFGILFLIVLFIIINVIGYTKVFIYTNLFSEITSPVDNDDNIRYVTDIKRQIENDETCTNYIMYIGNYVDENEKNIYFEYCSNISEADVFVDNNKIIFKIQKPTLNKSTVKAKGDDDYKITEDMYYKIDDYVNSEDEPIYTLAVKSTMEKIAKSAIGEKALENKNIVVKYY
jgi:hypothetical protein